MTHGWGDGNRTSQDAVKTSSAVIAMAGCSDRYTGAGRRFESCLGSSRNGLGPASTSCRYRCVAVKSFTASTLRREESPCGTPVVASLELGFGPPPEETRSLAYHGPSHS